MRRRLFIPDAKSYRHHIEPARQALPSLQKGAAQIGSNITMPARTAWRFDGIRTASRADGPRRRHHFADAVLSFMSFFSTAALGGRRTFIFHDAQRRLLVYVPRAEQKQPTGATGTPRAG